MYPLHFSTRDPIEIEILLILFVDRKRFLERNYRETCRFALFRKIFYKKKSVNLEDRVETRASCFVARG